MLEVVGFPTVDSLIDATVPKAIRREDKLDLGKYSRGYTESEFLAKFKYVGMLVVGGGGGGGGGG